MRIAIVKLSAIGDIVHAMIVLQFIKNFNKEILIDWFVDREFKELLENNDDINQIYTLNLKKAKKNKSLLILLTELNKLKKLDYYDVVIDIQGLIKSAVISKLIPSKKTIGFDRDSIRERLASSFYSDKFQSPYSQNVIDRNISLVAFSLGFNVSNKQIQNKNPFIFARKQKINFNLSNSKKNIILIPGASHISKCYPANKFAELSKLIDANFVVIWGNEKEKLVAEKIKEFSPKILVCNKLSLEKLIILISMVDLVIGPDTGPTHISWALNIPSITLFGPTPGYRNTYETSINKIIESGSKVNPYKIDKSDKSIRFIDVQNIADVANQLIGK